MNRLPSLRKADPPLLSALVLLLGAFPAVAQDVRPTHSCTSGNTVHAYVVALDQVYFWNRLGAVQPQGMMYALERDVVHVSQDESSCAPDMPLVAGQVKLRKGKRPRPLVLRVNQGECLQVHFRNLLISTPPSGPGHFDDEAPYTREASIHVTGMQYVTSIQDAGMKVGKNAGNGGVVSPGGSATYTLYAEKEGTFLLYNGGAMVGGEGLNGSISAGLFGAVNVEPVGSEHYRSQVSRKEFDLFSATLSSSTEDEHPIINYAATYSTTSVDPEICRRRGIPILKMRQGNEIVHSDLTAIITGPGAGALTSAPASSELYPERTEPYREFTILFHDEIGATQAFPHFEDEILSHTLHGVREGFAINYGTAGAGAEILANRLGVGPMADCVECKYEEFFLTSWAVGDPAMVVDVPANSPCMVSVSNNDPSAVRPSDQPFETHVDRLRDGNHTACAPTPGPKATKAFFPDDPSNVYHSYLNDHVKFRNLLAGSDDHHIFHLHAHQWLHTPRSNLSSYLDSQAIGQGTGFTYEITFGGSGNQNKTVGDSIFHCHFYPHFAQGMWALWRVHDVFENGTQLNANGRPTNGARALPDAEILRGTPIPGLVPLPTLPMAPLPGPVSINTATGQIQLPAVVTQNPGFPFFVPGIAGARPPQPPLDLIDDGGLPRHVVTGGTATADLTVLHRSMNKVLDTLNVNWLPNAGTPVETVAMNFHATAAGFATPTPSGSPASKVFKVNGRAPVRGAPFADPCPNNNARLRTYKGADFQLDVVFNKAGWHFPQQRIIALWEDVWPTVLGTRTPEPLFFRAHSGDCVEYQFTNLVPNVYHLDDFQIETPTDTLGQHIHLVKFDVLASDGAANGFNYEDGSFSPEEVQERLCAIRRAQPGMCGEPATGHCHFTTASANCPVPEKHPYFGGYSRDADCNGVDDFLGAQTTVQRWYVNPLSSLPSSGRTIRTVFTHDHFGPSTHQQTGLYGGLVIEPPGSTWYHNEDSSIQLSNGSRADGGPTSWQAVIDSGANTAKTYREFMLELADFQLAYEPNSPKCPTPVNGILDWSNPSRAVNPPGRKKADVSQLSSRPWIYDDPNACPLNQDDPDGSILVVASPNAPCPEAVSADDPGTGVLNYRNEPIPFRIRDPNTNRQGSGAAGDLAFAYETRTDRLDNEFNKLPYAPFLLHPPYPALTNDLKAGDPFTPMLRAYEGDDIHLRVLVGAHEEEHSFTVNGMKWRFEPDDPNSGYRNGQMMGISEWFDMDIPPTPSLLQEGEWADSLYKPSASSEFQWNGIWGLIRYYHGERNDLMVLPTNGTGRVSPTVRDPQLRPLDSSFTYTEPTLVGVPSASTDAETLREPDGNARSATIATVNPQQTIVNPSRTRRLPCPPGTTVTKLDITAVAAAEALLNDNAPVPGIIYNSRLSSVAAKAGPLHDPTGIMFVYTEDLSWVSTVSGPRPRLKQNVRREPLILRANRGECIQVTLRNALPPKYWKGQPEEWDPSALPVTYSDKLGWNAMPNVIDEFNANQVRPSLEVGLHPQLMYYDLRSSDGQNIGTNPTNFGKQTVSPGELVTYHWYSGHWNYDGSSFSLTPVEFGSSGLTSADPIKHSNKGAVGALIIEPTGSTWELDENGESFPWSSLEPIRKTRASVTVTPGAGKRFREFVQVYHDDVNLRYIDDSPVPSLDINEDAQESAQKGMNYRTDPVWFRIGIPPQTETGSTRTFTNFDDVFKNSWIGGADPETPTWVAPKGMAVRMRVVHPAGHTQAHSWEAQGHIWEEEPYTSNSTTLGSNASSEWVGSRYGVGPGTHFDALLKNGAGGAFAPVDGHSEGSDYMCKDYASWHLYDGIWNIFRVTP